MLLPKHIKKRDGSIDLFNPVKIKDAVLSAVNSVHLKNPIEATEIICEEVKKQITDEVLNMGLECGKIITGVLRKTFHKDINTIIIPSYRSAFVIIPNENSNELKIFMYGDPHFFGHDEINEETIKHATKTDITLVGQRNIPAIYLGDKYLVPEIEFDETIVGEAIKIVENMTNVITEIDSRNKLLEQELLSQEKLDVVCANNDAIEKLTNMINEVRVSLKYCNKNLLDKLVVMQLIDGGTHQQIDTMYIIYQRDVDKFLEAVQNVMKIEDYNTGDLDEELKKMGIKTLEYEYEEPYF